MNDPITIVALILAAIAAAAALFAAARSGRTAPPDPTSTLQAQRVEDQLQSVVERLARIDAAQQGIERLREIVVCPHFQPLDPVGDAIPRRQEQDRDSWGGRGIRGGAG
jgi:hypothetical protein